MQLSSTVALIMAGGRGERFWPRSRSNLPKQFLNIVGNKSMLQQTVDRIRPLVPIERIFVSTGADYHCLVKEQIPDLPGDNIIIEPIGKDTAPCIGLATLFIERKYPCATLIVLPADHLILKSQNFLNCLELAVAWALEGNNIVTLGIRPTRPETGYGYIQLGIPAVEEKKHIIYRVKAFKEKPGLPMAEEFLSAGNYLWNSGMLIWRLDTVKKLFGKHLPEISSILSNINTAMDTGNLEQVLEREFGLMPKISVDYGILEKADDVYVIPGDFGWDDVGGWHALNRVCESDGNGNIVTGSHVGIDTSNCIIEGNGKLVVTIGLQGAVVVSTEDVVLVCNKDRAGDLKEVLSALRERGLINYI